MPSDIVIQAQALTKRYNIYDKPQDRLLQMLLRNRKKFYREFWALRDVSFEIARSGAVGIIGRNGSGKSTLLQIVCGTLAPTGGAVTTHGRIAALLELGSGFNPEFTGRENVYMNAAVLGLRKDEIDQRFDKITAFADIGDFIEQPVKTYSSGMYMRLAFAVAAHVDAEILIIDEALAVGDALFTQKCMRFLRDFKSRGTLLFVSHDAAAVVGLCDSALWLNEGVTMAFGPAKEVSEQYLAFLHESDVPRLPAASARLAAEKPDKSNSRPRRVAVTTPPSSRAADSSNPITVFQFSPGASLDFGLRGAEIRQVQLMNSEGKALSQLSGGEDVTLRVEVSVFQDIDRPIVGFHIKDRLGQALFGENTYKAYRLTPNPATAGDTIIAEFAFSMPILPTGDYTISVAIATVTQEVHVQHHWIHDALVIKSLSSSVSTGLIGIPMQSISMAVE